MTQTGQTGVTGSETDQRSALDLLESIVAAVAGASLVGVVLVQSWQVFARYILNDSPSWTEPVSLFLVSNAALLGAAIGARKGTHFAFPTLADMSPRPVGDLLRLVGGVSMLAFGVGLAAFGAVLTMDALSVKMAGAPLPAGLKFAPVALGGALIALFSLERLLKPKSQTGAG